MGLLSSLLGRASSTARRGTRPAARTTPRSSGGGSVGRILRGLSGGRRRH